MGAIETVETSRQTKTALTRLRDLPGPRGLPVLGNPSWTYSLKPLRRSVGYTFSQREALSQSVRPATAAP